MNRYALLSCQQLEKKTIEPINVVLTRHYTNLRNFLQRYEEFIQFKALDIPVVDGIVPSESRGRVLSLKWGTLEMRKPASAIVPSLVQAVSLAVCIFH